MIAYEVCRYPHVATTKEPVESIKEFRERLDDAASRPVNTVSGVFAMRSAGKSWLVLITYGSTSMPLRAS